MSNKVMLCGIQKEDGWLYYVDKEGDISRAKANHKGRPRGARNR
jgi:hypothetical protein